MEIGGDSKHPQQHSRLAESTGQQRRDECKHPQQHSRLAESTGQQRRDEWNYNNAPSDFTIQVSGETFALHKSLLASKSERIRKLIENHRESDLSKFEFLNLPGGAESFNLAAKFCYGITFEITPANVAQLCCVSNYLGMRKNLGAHVEEYLDSAIYTNPEKCVEVLKQCESLIPLADELNIVSRCIDVIANECEGDWRIANLSVLRIDLYERVIIAMKCSGARPEIIGGSLVNYAKELTEGSIDHQRLVLETLVRLFPVGKLTVPVGSLFRLLRGSVVFGCSLACRVVLEKRIGSQLDMATLDDLLISSSSSVAEFAVDVNTVERILCYFCEQCDSEDELNLERLESESESESESEGLPSPSQTAMFKVCKLMDKYLAKIALDADLEVHKFIAIAESLPARKRVVHDGLYRAIDVYLMAHQGLTEADKIRLSMLIEFNKLSREDGQIDVIFNMRMPLQPIVQGLYFEQLRLQKALFCSYPEEESSSKNNCASLRRENKELKLEMARLRMRLDDLEEDHASMKRSMEKTGL